MWLIIKIFLNSVANTPPIKSKYVGLLCQWHIHAKSQTNSAVDVTLDKK